MIMASFIFRDCGENSSIFELRSQWEYAVDLKFNDKMNNGYLDENFDADPRPGVVASLTASSLSKMPYQQRLDALHTLYNCDNLDK